MIDWRKGLRKLGVALNLRDPPNLPAFGWSYFDHLVAVYVNLNTSDPRADAVIKKSRDHPDDLTWGDIFLLENTNFSLMPPDVVDRSAWLLRERFREIAGSPVYDKYIASNPPKDIETPAQLSLLKADLTRVLDVLHWYYSLIPQRESLRRSQTVYCIALVAAYTLALGLLLALFNKNHFDFLAMLTCVVYFGIVGGFVSSQRRMQALPNDGDPLISVFGLDSASYYLWLSPMLGAIFAVILTLMFIGGILKGSVFPDFGSPGQGGFFSDFTWATLPKDSENYGKLLIWAFLAGFAERLVPDNLDRLAEKLDPSGQATATQVPPSTTARPAQVQQNGDSSPVPEPKITPETLQNVMHTGETPDSTQKNNNSGG